MPFNFRFPSRPGLRKTSSPSRSHRINIEVALVVGYPAKSFTNPASNIITLATFQDRTEFSVGTGTDQDGPEQPLGVLDLLMR
jgi:hypothetical protein